MLGRKEKADVSVSRVGERNLEQYLLSDPRKPEAEASLLVYNDIVTK